MDNWDGSVGCPLTLEVTGETAKLITIDVNQQNQNLFRIQLDFELFFF